MGNDKDIAVVGMACVFPRAAGLGEFWSNLVNGVDAIGDPPPGRWERVNNFSLPPGHDAFLPCRRGGYLPRTLFDPAPYGIPPNLVRYGDPDQFLMLQLIDGALRDARVAADSPVRRRTDLFIGRGGYPTGKHIEMNLRVETIDAVLELIEQRFPDLLGGRRQEVESYLRSTLTPAELDHFATALPNLTAGRAANRLNLRGTACVVDGACASSLLAVEQAVWRLRNGLCDLAVAAGLFVTLSPQFLHVFTRLGALSASGVIRPFDRRADGVLIGEGGGAVALKRLADAVKDEDEVYAILKGVGSSSDGRDVDVLAPSSPGQVLALERAYADAGLDPATVGYLELHGTGIVAGDQAELATLKAFFGTAQRPPAGRAMGSVKSMIGHTMPAAGIASLIKTALTLSNKILPPSLHAEEPRPELADAPFYLNTQTRPWVHNPARGPRRAGINAFGFGGINAHVVLEEVATPGVGAASRAAPPEDRRKAEFQPRPRPVVTGLRRPSELVVFTAATEEELQARLARVERFLGEDGTGPALADVAAALAREADLSRPVKLALICTDLPHLRRLLGQCRQAIPAPGTSEEVYFAAGAAGHQGKVVVTFPGMGFVGLSGNYPEHLRELCLFDPEVRAEFDFFEDRDGHPEDPDPTSAILWPPPALGEDFRTRVTARLATPTTAYFHAGEFRPAERYLSWMGMTLGHWAGWTLLQKFRFPVDVVHGHSLGEFVALCAAGAADFHRLAPLFWHNLDLAAIAPLGARLGVACAGPERLAPLLAEYPGVHMAIHVMPEVVVLGGDGDGLERIAERLGAEHVWFHMLPYPPIHTPLLGHLRGQMQGVLDAFGQTFAPPRLDSYSSITCARYPQDPEQIREILLMNADLPVLAWQTIRRMYDDGARIFVQAGDHTAIHPDMLEPGSEVVIAPLFTDSRHPITQLNHACATLFCAGVPLDFAPLYAYRTPRQLDLDSPRPALAPSPTAVPLRLSWSPLDHAGTAAAPAVPAPAPTPDAPRKEPQAAEPQAGPDLSRLPVLGAVTHFVPEKELVIERTLDLAEDLYLHDHLFVHAECKPAADRSPVLPLTMSLEFLAEAAALLSPGLGLIGFEDIRGLQWIRLSGESGDLRIEAQVRSTDPETGVRRVHATFSFGGRPSFTGVALFAAAYRQDLAPDVGEPGDGPWPYSAEECYAERHLFHGPRFRLITRLGDFGNPAAGAVLTVRPRDDLFASRPDPLLLTDPCVMDAAGQVVGMYSRACGHCTLPIQVRKIELYGPFPAPGTELPLRLEVVAFEPHQRLMRFNLEVEDGRGGALVRIAGWTNWVLGWPDAFEACYRLPDRYVVADEPAVPGLPADGVCALMTPEHIAGPDLEWVAQLFLHAREMGEFKALTDPRRRREWVLSRAAVKEAARLWYARKYGTALPHPASFFVAHEESGRPFLGPAGERPLPHVSLAHTAAGAVAIAAGVPVGVDLEPAGRGTRAILAEFATAGEAALLEEVGADGDAETRLWCAKEAFAKLLGTGLQGRPKDFEAIAAEDGSFLMYHHPDGERLGVGTARVGDFIVAAAAGAKATLDVKPLQVTH